MKVTVATISVTNERRYDPFSERWVRTYKEHRPALEHELLVVNDSSDRPLEVYEEVADRFVRYDGGGWDCGIWVHLARTEEADLLVCCNTSTHFVRDGWLERLVEAVERHGEGLYGPFASLAYAPHIRTPCYVFQPSVFRDYPHTPNSRQWTYTFEALGIEKSGTNWTRSKGLPTMQVAWDGEYDLPDWRKAPNVFQKGDQSNLLLKDRHCDMYDNSPEEGREKMTKLVDGR